MDLHLYLDRAVAQLTASAREHALPPAIHAIKVGVAAGTALGLTVAAALITIGFILGKVFS